MSGVSPSPPSLPAWVLENVLPAERLEYVLGDLAEEYALRWRRGSSSAALWYWLQICRSLPVLFSAALRYAGWLQTIGVAVAAYLAASVVESLVTWSISLLALNDFTLYVASMIVGLSSIGIGGYVAARIRPPAAPIMAIIVLTVVVVLITIKGDAVPVWYQVVFLFGGPFVPLAGGVRASRDARRRTSVDR